MKKKAKERSSENLFSNGVYSPYSICYTKNIVYSVEPSFC
jgi:hypothetical protein